MSSIRRQFLVKKGGYGVWQDEEKISSSARMNGEKRVCWGIAKTVTERIVPLQQKLSGGKSKKGILRQGPPVLFACCKKTCDICIFGEKLADLSQRNG